MILPRYPGSRGDDGAGDHHSVSICTCLASRRQERFELFREGGEFTAVEENVIEGLPMVLRGSCDVFGKEERNLLHLQKHLMVGSLIGRDITAFYQGPIIQR